MEVHKHTAVMKHETFNQFRELFPQIDVGEVKESDDAPGSVEVFLPTSIMSSLNRQAEKIRSNVAELIEQEYNLRQNNEVSDTPTIPVDAFTESPENYHVTDFNILAVMTAKQILGLDAEQIVQMRKLIPTCKAATIMIPPEGEGEPDDYGMLISYHIQSTLSGLAHHYDVETIEELLPAMESDPDAPAIAAMYGGYNEDGTEMFPLAAAA